MLSPRFRFGALGLSIALAAFAAFGSPHARAANQSVFGAPVVVVYPLTVSGVNSKNSAGDDVATLIASRIASDGGVTVKPFIPGTVRANYLTAANAEGADYYVTGYLQPLGNDVSMVLQVVSVHSGSVVYSTTAEIKTYADAMALADPVHSAIAAHAGRAYASLDAPPPAPTPSPVESAGHGGFSLSRIFGNHSHDDASASPSPSASADGIAGSVQAPSVAAQPAAPTAVPSSAPATMLVVAPVGNAPAAERDEARATLVAQLRASGVAAIVSPYSIVDVRTQADRLCKAFPATRSFALPNLDFTRRGGKRFAVLAVTEYDCTGATKQTASQSSQILGNGGPHQLSDAILRSAAALAATRTL